MPQDSIIDTSKPNAGRIYDYLLGGSHNFEVDRHAADELIKLVPFLPKASRLQRWCLQDIARELTEKRGFDVIIDFASGLPTNDHMHAVVPKGTTVIYSDRDPVVVEYAKEILAGAKNVYYFHAEATRPEELLNRPEVTEILKGRKHVALVYWGVSFFLKDDDIAHASRALAEWADPKSCFAFNAMGAVEMPTDPQVQRLTQIYAQMGSPVYFRPLKRFQEILAPWHAEAGFVSLLDWHGVDKDIMTTADQSVWSTTSGMYGSYMVK
jgi:SAM-dependent methyltransferase